MKVMRIVRFKTFPISFDDPVGAGGDGHERYERPLRQDLPAPRQEEET